MPDPVMMRRPVLLLALCTQLACVACSGGDDDSPPADAGGDAGVERSDAGPLPGAVFDTSTTWKADPLPCPDGAVRREGSSLGDQRRFALSVLHYNIQYVAGGIDNFRVAGSEPYDGWDDDRVQDSIVTESLEPVLDMLDRHPTWTLSLEMQGYMVEVLLARHRDTAQHLADLVASGQVELLSFHYSDQLFLAYPRHHMEWSRTIGGDVLADACIEASAPVFTQEGQYGRGMADLLGDGSIILLPKNLYRHFQGDGDVAPWYEVRGVPVVIGGKGLSDAASGFEVQWIYADDAELLATGDINPYFPDVFVYDPEVLGEFETRLEGLEADGWAIAGVADYAATLEEAGVAREPLPPVLDGTWQPDDTGNLARWMGDGGLFTDMERDLEVLDGNARAGRMVLAAEVAVEAARAAGDAPAGADGRLERAWRDLLLGEVSDATGWNPISNEVEYARWHAEAATGRARDLAVEAAAALGVEPPFVVDTASGTVGPAAGAPLPETEAVADPPLEIDAAGADRSVDVSWERYTSDPDHLVVTVDFGEAPGAVRAAFPWSIDSVRYTPALLEDETVDVPLSDLSFTETAIPVGAGAIALDDSTWLVPDTASVHLAARLDPAAHTIAFRDETLPADDGARWVFHVVLGDEAAALAVADRVNIHPVVRVDAP